MKRFFRNTVLLLLAVAVVLTALRNPLARVLLPAAIARGWGVSTRVQNIAIGLTHADVRVSGLQIMNPPGFSTAVMLDVPEVHAVYDLPALLHKRLRLPELHLTVAAILVERNSRGELNIGALKTGGSADRHTAPVSTPSIAITRVKLHIGTIVYRDLTTTPPRTLNIPVNLDEEIPNVQDQQRLAEYIIMRALMNTSLQALLNFDVRSLGINVQELLKTTGARELDNAVNKATDVLKSIFK